MIARLMGIGIALLLGVTGLFADTIPGGDVSGNWYRSHSPYYIAGNITVPAGDTLTIEPAVRVNFLGASSLTVNGWLEAVGTQADSIYFAGGNGFVFSDAQDSSHLVYCSVIFFSTVRCSTSNPVISHSSIDGFVYGIRVEDSSNPRISDCLISNSGVGIYWYSNVSGTISGCVISRNPGGGVIQGGGRLTFIDCNISDNKSSNFAGGVFSYGGNVDFINCTISNDSTFGKDGGGVACHNGTATFTNCTIKGNYSQDLGSYPYIGGGGISLYHANAVLSHCTVFGNFATPHGGGIAVDTGSLSIDHCTIDGNESDCGMYPGSAIVIIGGGTTADITNSIISNNYGWTSNACGIYNQGTLTVDYSDFYRNEGGDVGGNIPTGFGILDTTNYNGDSCDVYYNIFLDPMYVDSANGDYHLLAGSPCIDAGDPLFAHDPDSTITDIGAFWFNQSSGVAIGPPASIRLPAYRAYPNPFTSFATVPGHSSDRFALYDISGRRVGVYRGDRIGEGLRAGVYFLRSSGQNGKLLRVVKVR